MRRFLGILVGATILSMPLAVSGHNHLRHQFFVYCEYTTNYMPDAWVQVTYGDGESQGGFTRWPHGDIVFRLPGEVTTVDLEVEYDKPYCKLTVQDFELDSRPRNGGKGYWIGIYPGCPQPER